MKTLVIGGDSQVGRKFSSYMVAPGTSRKPGSEFYYDLLTSRPSVLPEAETVYLIASMTRFRDCEINPDAYAVNVDAQVAIAAHFKKSHIVYISSEAAEWPNQTAYGSQKRFCELSLLAVCGYDRLCVVRPRKIMPEAIDSFCVYLAHLGRNKNCGVYRWEWKGRDDMQIAA